MPSYYAYILSLLAKKKKEISGHLPPHVNEGQKHIALQHQSNTLLKSVSTVIPEASTSHLSQEIPRVLCKRDRGHWQPLGLICRGLLSKYQQSLRTLYPDYFRTFADTTLLRPILTASSRISLVAQRR